MLPNPGPGKFIGKAGFKKKKKRRKIRRDHYAGLFWRRSKQQLITSRQSTKKDPRKVTSKEMTELAKSVSSQHCLSIAIKRSDVVVSTGITRQIFFLRKDLWLISHGASSGVTIFVLSQK